ncbi:MAG: hypothetical protein DRG50_00380 [Deltaproteobacteria bacterium]|nr:MAG: hypothetical protein DRG50_00380 [Deltaproteobacteria bacterium]
MDLVEEFQRRFGGRWIGLKFYRDELPPVEEVPRKGVRFCEAITRSLTRPLLLTPEGLNCRGACYVFGWNEGGKEEMVDRFHTEGGFSRQTAKRLVEDLPKIYGPLKGIGLNVKNGPDVLLSYLQPGQVMKLLRDYQLQFGEDLKVDLSSIVSVCGHVAVEAFVEGRIALSFGCSDARRYGRITRDRVAIGVPTEVAKNLLRGGR